MSSLPDSPNVRYPFWMHAEFDLHLHCRCGHDGLLRAEDMPASWLHDPHNLLDGVTRRMRCSACGHRGRPRQVIVSPVENRYRGMGGAFRVAEREG